MRTRLSITIAVLAAAALFLTASPAVAGSITIGQPSGNAPCAGGFTVFEPTASVSYVVPSGSWTMTSWSTQAGAGGGQMAVLVLRPVGGGSYTVVDVGATETLTPNTVNTFATSMAVQGGDVIGMWESGGATCLRSTGVGSDAALNTNEAKPSPGQTETPPFSANGYLVNISATLVGGAGAVIPQVNNLFVCYSKYEQDGGAVFPSSVAVGLLNAGNWVPSAVAGNVDGGDNIGGYHLECNPPATLKPTGQYVGGGGDVVDAAAAASAVYGYYSIVA